MYDDKATAWLADHAVGGKSGARDLRNLIRRKVEDALAELLIERCDSLPEGIFVTSDGEQILLKTLPEA